MTEHDTGPCIPARGTRPPPVGLSRWTTDLCPFVAFGFVKIDDPKDPEYGRWGLLSNHRVRAVDGVALTSQHETCKHHRGHMTIGADGHAEPVWCSNPASGERQLHIGRVYVTDTDANEELGEPGRAGVLGKFHAPYWFETILFGGVSKCGSPV